MLSKTTTNTTSSIKPHCGMDFYFSYNIMFCTCLKNQTKYIYSLPFSESLTTNGYRLFLIDFYSITMHANDGYDTQMYLITLQMV